VKFAILYLGATNDVGSKSKRSNAMGTLSSFSCQMLIKE